MKKQLSPSTVKHNKWKERNREKYLEYKRNWTRAYRGSKLPVNWDILLTCEGERKRKSVLKVPSSERVKLTKYKPVAPIVDGKVRCARCECVLKEGEVVHCGYCIRKQKSHGNSTN
jgi:hypothetical protein